MKGYFTLLKSGDSPSDVASVIPRLPLFYGGPLQGIQSLYCKLSQLDCLERRTKKNPLYTNTEHNRRKD